MVESLWTDLLDDSGSPQICAEGVRGDTRSPHRAAQDLLEMVLGKALVRRRGLTREALLAAPRNAATRLLGQTVQLREGNSKAFNRAIKRYVDSKNHSEAGTATWPLVKVCRIRHSWQVLANGAMLVDLPGLRDANAARGRVAEAGLSQELPGHLGGRRHRARRRQQDRQGGWGGGFKLWAIVVNAPGRRFPGESDASVLNCG